jgi:HEAT repeat protein
MNPTPESVDQLLTSDNYGDRISGVNQLRKLDPACAFDLIQKMVTDQNVRVRYAAVSQLSSLGKQDRPLAFTILRDRLLNDPETDVKAAAADSLGALQLTEAYPDLAQTYHNTSEWLLQFSIVACLGEMGDPRSFTLLQEALSSPIELIQTAAIVALGELGDTRAIPIIISFLSHPDWQIRHRVAQALGHFERSLVHVALKTLAQDPQESVAQEAQRILLLSMQDS